MLDKTHIHTLSPSAVKLCLAAMFFLLAVLGTGCGQASQQVEESDSTALRIGVLPTQSALPLLYAQRMGEAQRMGLRIVRFQSVADIDTALMSGSIDVALTDTVRLRHLLSDSVTLAAWGATQLRLTTLCPARDTLWLIIADSAKVEGTADLQEKLVGMLRYSDASEAMHRLMKVLNYDEGEVFFIQVGDLRVRHQMLCARLLDGAFLPHPYSDDAIRRGHTRMPLAATDTLCQGVWVARGDTTGRHIDAFIRLLNAPDSVFNPDTLRRVMQDEYGLDVQ